MGKVFIEGSGFGIDTEDITARANDVVEGKTTINDDGDIVQGEVRLLTKQNIHGIDKAIRAVRRSDEWGAGKYHWSEENGDALIIPLKTNDNKRHMLENDVEFLFVPTPGLSSYNMLEGTNVLGLQGRIPLRRVDTDMYNVMLAYDRGDFWGKGRCATHSKTLGPGVITSIKPPNGEKAALHEDVCFVFLPEANLLPQNIKQGVTMFGVVGTAPDYTSGRVAFRDATFDGTLLSGVANNKYILNGAGSLRSSVRYYDTVYKYLGVNNNGLIFNFSKKTNSRGPSDDVGIVFSSSVNLTPFRTIRIGYKLGGVSGTDYTDGSKSGLSLGYGIYKAIKKNERTIHYGNEIEIEVTTGGTLLRGGYSRYMAENCYVERTPSSTLGNFSDIQRWHDIDVSYINEEAFITLGFFNVSENEYKCSLNGNAYINHIEFIN